MTKKFICYECGEPVKFGETCNCKYFEVPEEFLTPQQIIERDYEGTYDD